MAYSMCVGKVRIISAATSAFYRFEDPHIRILPLPNQPVTGSKHYGGIPITEGKVRFGLVTAFTQYGA